MNSDDELHLVYFALLELERENRMWESNRNTFGNFERKARWAWWLRAKKFAAESQLPMYQTLVQKVIQLRLES